MQRIKSRCDNNTGDFDGDIVFLTDNNVLVNRLEPLPALMCAQRKAEKRVSTEQDFVESNINSFGNEIGSVTNRITSMYEVRAGYPTNSKEYEILSYRIKCGQQAQQDSIDKSKGIICKPMPKNWYDWHSAKSMEPAKDREFYLRIIADKKPYFMIYIYPSLKKQYNTYINSANRNAIREFGISIDELTSLPYSELSERQRDFLKHYYNKMPVGTRDCVMNRICRRFENEFDSYVRKHKSDHEFDYHILRSEAPYTYQQYLSVKKLYEEYTRRLQNYSIYANYERIDEQEALETYWVLNDSFVEDCTKVCPNKDSLCNIILDVCYQKSCSKRFAWNMCGDEIINNLLQQNDGYIRYPVEDEDGDIYYCGNTFKVHEKKYEVSE